jgi:hypothetical protein
MRFIRANRDTVALIEDGARFSDFLVDWAATPIRFWWNSFARKVLEHACATAGIPLILRLQNGYDHSYYFVSTFMTDHLRLHAARLKEAQGSISNSLRRAVVGCEQPVSHQIAGSAGPGFVGITYRVSARGSQLRGDPVAHLKIASTRPILQGLAPTSLARS